MKISIFSDENFISIPAMTMVPSAFLDKYLSDANGEFLKVYLLLAELAQRSEDASLVTLADRLDMTERDVKRAVSYWEDRGELGVTRADDVIMDIRLMAWAQLGGEVMKIFPATPASVPAAPAQAIVAPASTAHVPAGITNATRAFAETASVQPVSAADLSKDKNFKELLYVIEQYIGKRLGSMNADKVAYWYGSMGVPKNLIEYIVESCVENGHTGIPYIEKVVVDSWENGVRTVEQMQRRGKMYRSEFYTILKAFGIRNRAPISREQEMMTCWIQEYGFTMDVIIEACTRSVDKERKFEYANSILKGWHEADVKTISDVQALDEKYRISRGGQAGSQSGQAQTASQTSAGGVPPASGHAFNRRPGFDNFSKRDYDFGDIMSKIRRKNKGL